MELIFFLSFIISLWNPELDSETARCKIFIGARFKMGHVLFSLLLLLVCLCCCLFFAVNGFGLVVSVIGRVIIVSDGGGIMVVSKLGSTGFHLVKVAIKAAIFCTCVN